MIATSIRPKHFLLVSDFDQTLSFNDSGLVLSELIGASGFQDKVAGLSRSNLVQQGAELAYLIRHDPDFRGIRREHLLETGRRVRLRRDIPALMEFLQRGIEGLQFSFFVASAAPKEVIESALHGIVSPEHIYGTELDYDPRSGEVTAIRRVPAGYGKVSVVEELEAQLGTDRTIYVGDGGSDVHVMLHVNNQDGFTIAVSENKLLARIAKSTVLSDSAFSIVVPILEQVVGWRSAQIRELIEAYGLTLHDWEKARTEPLVVVEALGWVATATFIGSYFFKRPEMLVRAQMVGGVMWVAYGVLVHAKPVVAANVLVVLAAAWKTWRPTRTPKPASASLEAEAAKL
jgi:phosphoserine phosphatase